MKLVPLFFILISLVISPCAWARVCDLQEIEALDTARFSEDYSPYPLMSRANIALPLIAYLPRLDSTSQENNGFQAVTFIGLGAWIYHSYKTLHPSDCWDARQGSGSLYQPKLNEVLAYHLTQKEFFWQSYTWSAVWMAGVMLTSQYNERKTAAGLALALPWAFSLSRHWSAFAEDQDLQISLLPGFENHQWVLKPTLVFNY